MNRRIFPALVLSLLLSALGGLGVAGQDSNGNVPMFRGNPAHTGEMAGPGPDPNEDIVPLWWALLGSGVASSPAVVDGVVYFGGEDGFVYAFDLDGITGQFRWSFQTGDVVFSSPAVVDGVVYVGSADGSLYAIDAASGQQLWEFQTGDIILSSPAVLDGVVYVGSDNNNLYAIDATSGQQRWSFPTDGDVDSSPAVVDGTVYVGSYDGSLYAIDAASGQQRWSFPTGDAIDSSPTVDDGVVYVGSQDGKLYAIDTASGQQVWGFPTGDGIDSSPAVVLGVVYFGSGDGTFYAVQADTGQQRWDFSPGDGWISSSAAVADGVVYFGSDSGIIYALDASSGQRHWDFPAGDAVISSPAVAGGTIFFGTEGGFLYAIGNATPAIATATAQAQQAEVIQQSWDSYFQGIGTALTEEVGDLPGMAIVPAGNVIGDVLPPNIPGGSAQNRIYGVSIAGGSAWAWVDLSIFRSKDEADAALADLSGGLLRSGWQAADVDGLDHNHACLTLQSADSSEAICYLARDDALIVGDSTIQVPNSEAALLNAVDLANAMSDAYDQVVPPADLLATVGDVQ